MSKTKDLGKIFGKKNLNVGEILILLENMSTSVEDFVRWVDANQTLMSMSEKIKKSIVALNELDESLYTLGKSADEENSNIEDGTYSVETFEINLKDENCNIDISDWEESNVKPIKVIVSCIFSSRTNFGVLNKPSDVWCMTEAIAPFNVRFAIKDVALLMEDGTFRICNRE